LLGPYDAAGFAAPAGDDVGAAAFALALVRAADLVLRAFGHREKIVRRVEIAAERGAHELAAHLVHLIDGVADRPDAHVDVAAGADGRIGERKKLAGAVPVLEDGGKFGLVRRFLLFGKPAPLRHDFVEAEGYDLALDGGLRGIVRSGSVAAGRAACCRGAGGAFSGRWNGC